MTPTEYTAEKGAPRHSAIVMRDPEDPQKSRAWCPACGWRAKIADYGMADAWGRAKAHNRSTRPSLPGRETPDA